MALVFAGVILIIGAVLIGLYVWGLERTRMESIRQTIIDSGKTDLTGVLSMYPEEMYEEVTRVWRQLNGNNGS